MKRHTCLAVIISSLDLVFRSLAFLALASSAVAQTATPNSSPTSASAQVPPVIQFSNVATDAAGGPLTSPVEITFSLYNNPRGRASL